MESMTDTINAERIALDAPLQDRVPLFDHLSADVGDEIAIGYDAAIELAVTRARNTGRRQVMRSAFPDDATLRRFFAVQAWR